MRKDEDIRMRFEGDKRIVSIKFKYFIYSTIFILIGMVIASFTGLGYLYLSVGDISKRFFIGSLISGFTSLSFIAAWCYALDKQEQEEIKNI